MGMYTADTWSFVVEFYVKCLFYQIESVVIIQNKPVLLTIPLFTVAFQEHFFAYEVTRTKKDFVAFQVDDLPYPRPFDIQMSCGKNDTTMYVVPYCYL